jgi:hypothetical protein
MINIEYFANRVKAEREAGAARLARKKPVVRRNGKFVDLPETAASAVQLTSPMSARQGVAFEAGDPRLVQLTSSPGLL